MQEHNGISCVIITKNEEKNIERCILSVKDLADEIIVIDSYSEDNTENICKQHDVRFEQVEWKGYSETKNFGNSLAVYGYILSIDADEALSDELKTEIFKLKKEGLTSDGYIFKRLTNYCGKWIRHCGWYPDQKLRLWKKDTGQWEGYIHEEVKLKSDAHTVVLKSNLLHYSYYSINDHIRQMIKFTDLMAADLYNKDKKPGICKLTLSPLIKFFSAYIIRGGILDGFYGFVICILSSCATFLKYAKARQLFMEKMG